MSISPNITCVSEEGRWSLQGVTPLGQRIWHEVLQLAHLVSTKRQSGVDILSLGEDIDLAAQGLGDVGEGLNRGWAESKG